MIHLKYKCKVNFVKLPLIWIYLCWKLVFENATAGRNTGCRSVVNCACDKPTPPSPHYSQVSSPWPRQLFRRGSHEGVYGN